MMKKVILIFLALAIAETAAGREINEILDVSPNSQIDISNTAGDIDIEGWSRNQVEVTGELGSGVEDLQFERDGDDVTIKVRVLRNNSRGISSDLQIKVPVNSSIYVHGVSADIDVAGVLGEQFLASVSGDIDAEIYASDIEVSSVSGDVELQGDDEDMRANVHSVSGDVDLQNFAGEIEAASVSGDLAIIDSAIDRAAVNTINGDLVIHAALREGGRLTVETINGEVDIEFSGEVSARFDIGTTNGDIRNCFGPEPRRTNEYGPGYELRFTEGDGAGRVDISTLNGDLRLCKD